MALKVLMLRKSIDDKKKAIAELRAKDAEFMTRAEELEKAIEEANTEEERSAVTEMVNTYDSEKAEHEKTVGDLEREVAELEEELKATEVLPEEPKTVEPVEATRNGEMKMEIRESAEYIRAFANYIKTDDATEVRSLLSTNVSGGVVPVPTFVEGVVKTAWDAEGIMSRVKKSFIAGNLKVGFEKSATGAVVHTEGAAAPTEETLVLGVVELKAESIKKWLTISDEVMDMTDTEFLTYIYNELAYQIAKKAADELIADIIAAPATSSATAPAVPTVAVSAIALGTIAEAIGKLSDNAQNPVIIMNKQTWSAFKAVQYAGNYGIDIFEGLEVLFNNSMDSFAAASNGDTFAIVGDLGYGAQANFPHGQEISFKFDDLSLAEKDLVKIVGREFVGLGVVAPDAFVKITKTVG